MLTFDDCLSYCGLTEDEIKLVSRYEKITGLAAIAFAHNLLHSRIVEQEITESVQI